MGVSCYLCGRDFGRASFGIHLVSCMERWSREQGNDDGASVRQPSPPAGIELALSGNLKGRQLIEFNRESVALWKALVLKPCSACSRTFFPGQLKKHQAACRPSRPMGNPHKGPGRASQLEAGVSYPAKKSSDNGSGRSGGNKANKMGMQNQMEEFLQAVTSKQQKLIEEDVVEKRPGTYCVSRDRSLIPWYRLTSVQNIQASLREFITTIQANSVMMDKNELDELLRMTSLLKTGPSVEPRQQQRRTSTVSILPLPPIKKGRKVSSRRRGSEEGRSGERRSCLSSGEVSRKGSHLSPMRSSGPGSPPSRSFTYCSMPTVVF